MNVATTHDERIHLTACVEDTNGRKRGLMAIEVEFHDGGPLELFHDGRRYYATGKQGHNIATGLPAREMATELDERLWVSLDATRIWED